jgi:hypothetical protein
MNPTSGRYYVKKNVLGGRGARRARVVTLDEFSARLEACPNRRNRRLAKKLGIEVPVSEVQS